MSATTATIGTTVAYSDMRNPRRLAVVTATGIGFAGTEFGLTWEDGTTSTSDLRQAGWELVTTVADPAEGALHAAYIDGNIERPAYNAAIVAIHAARSASAELGRCTCLACREAASAEAIVRRPTGDVGGPTTIADYALAVEHAACIGTGRLF